MSSKDAESAPVDITNINTGPGVADAWLKMQKSSVMNPALLRSFDSYLPDMSKFAGSVLTDSTMDRMAELTKKMTAVMAPKFVDQHAVAMQNMLDQANGVNPIAKQISDQHAAISKMIDPSLSALKVMGYDERFQKSIAAMTSSFATSIDTSHIQDILASASTMMEELTDEDLEEIDDFFESHPDLAETVEELPMLYTLSKTDRALVVLFLRVCVTLTVACIMLNIEADLPDLQRLIDAFGGVGGWAVGKTAGELTGKALDKLPQAEEE